MQPHQKLILTIGSSSKKLLRVDVSEKRPINPLAGVTRDLTCLFNKYRLF
jgi:hypothetical protein